MQIPSFEFQPTLPARGATWNRLVEMKTQDIFQPTLPARGATPRRNPAPTCTRYFNPRSPHGERRRWHMDGCNAVCDFNPRSPHGERPNIHLFRVEKCFISTHAPRTGSDNRGRVQDTSKRSFQPTLPARGATRPRRRDAKEDSHFNPRSPHGERPFAADAQSDKRRDFNPRSPHGERPA